LKENIFVECTFFPKQICQKMENTLEKIAMFQHIVQASSQDINKF
jgi:hypothetical protein